LILRVTIDGGEAPWYFEPRLVVNAARYLSSGDLRSSFESPFAPIPIAKQHEVSRLVMVQPKPSAAFPFGRIRVGAYSIQVLCRINGTKNYKPVYEGRVDCSRKVLDALAATGNYVPEPAAVTEARNRLWQV
jgi:hypothetical protein